MLLSCDINPFLSPASAAGISRSVTITVAYLMTVSRLGFDESLTVVQHCREMANPNAGFRAQLVQYQQDKLLEVSGCGRYSVTAV